MTSFLKLSLAYILTRYERCFRVALLALFVFFVGSNIPVSAAPQNLENHVVAIAACPPWKAQAVEICANSIAAVSSAIAPRALVKPENQHLLINEGARASALKLKTLELANQLGPNDRLIIYANLPLSLPENGKSEEIKSYLLEFWSDHEPANASEAIASGTWISASAFAALLHAIPAGEVILIFDSNNPHTIDINLLSTHSVNQKDRPEALVLSSGKGQTANYSADRAISLFAKHFSSALEAVDGTLHDVVVEAANSTRQAAIPICIALKETQSIAQEQTTNCIQVPEIHDPAQILLHTNLSNLSEQESSK